MSESPNCWNCRFFKISWDPKFPYECQAMDFKSQGLPCAQVLGVDGRECQSFSPKTVKKSHQRASGTHRSTDRLA